MRKHIAVLVGAMLFLTAGKFEKLDLDEQDHFRAVQVFMGEKEAKLWLKLKDRSERDEYLKEKGYWERFYQYDEATRAAIVAGEVALSWDRDQVYMAWGAPWQKYRLTGREASRSEKLIYRFEVDKDGYAAPLGRRTSYKAVGHYQMEVVVDDDIVTDIVKKAEWD